MTRPLVPGVMAEFVGTAGLVFFIAGAIMVDTRLEGALGTLGLALVAGASYAGMIASTRAVSGGHVNPAVSVAAFLTGRLEASRCGAYVAAQVAGGILGALFARALLWADAGSTASYGLARVSGGVVPLSAVSLELVLSFFVVLAVFGVLFRGGPAWAGGAAVGAVVFLASVVGWHVTGAGLNPARALGPAVVSGAWSLQWVHVVGPVLGGALAGAVHEGFFEKDAWAEEEGFGRETIEEDAGLDEET